MKKLVLTADMTRAEWLQWRTCGIGGSDASIIAGVNAYTSIYQLWQFKTGKEELKEAENEYTHFGTSWSQSSSRIYTQNRAESEKPQGDLSE